MFFLSYILKTDPILLVQCGIFFRILMSALSAFLIVIFFCPRLIKKVKSLEFNQPVRSDGPSDHLKKIGTPSFGGISIILGVLTSVIIWGDLKSANLLLLISTMLCFALIGFLDDYRKVKENSPRGLSPSKKLACQFFFGGIILIIYHLVEGFKPPAFFNLIADNFFQLIGFNVVNCFYFVFALFLMLGTSNSVNLTDGLDGLAAISIFFSSLTLLFLILSFGNAIVVNSASFFCILENVNIELSIFCAAIIGAVIGFLWYNMHPAYLFMGDVGSLSLGAVIGLIVIMTKSEIFSLFFNMVFLVEATSVIFQILFFKVFNKRILRMAPVHHHFEILKYPENVIVVRFWIVNAIIFLASAITIFRVK